MAQKELQGVLQEDDSSWQVWRLRVGGGRTVHGPWRDGVLLSPSSPCERRPFANGRRPLQHFRILCYKPRISYILKMVEKKLLDLGELPSSSRIRYSGRSGKEKEGGRGVCV